MQLVLGADRRHRISRPRRGRGPVAGRRCWDACRHDIRDDRRAPGAPIGDGPDERMVLAAITTAAIEVHACHGRVRQVEVMRDAILHALAADDTLEPRDVIVMCPDIETFAPLISATFGAGERPPEDGEAPGRRARRAGRPDASRTSRAARRPGAAPDQPGARHGRGAAGARRRPPDRLAGARPRRPRPGAAAVRIRRRRSGAGSRTGSGTPAIRWGLDAPHRAAYSLQGGRRRHLGDRAWTACWSA